MNQSKVPGLVFFTVALVGCGLMLALPGIAKGSADPLHTAAIVAATGLALAVGLLWLAVDRLIMAHVRRLGSVVPMLAMGAVDIRTGEYGMLARLAGAMQELGQKIAQLNADTEKKVQEATRRAEEKTGQLAALLRDLHEGVLVCNAKHQILLYNEVARGLLAGGAELGLGRPLVQMVTREPLQHTLDRLRRRIAEGRHHEHAEGTTARFVVGAADGRLLQARMAAILSETEGVTGYVVTLEDATKELAVLAHRDSLLRAATEDVRGPLANLSAAAEMLSEHPDMAAEERAPFDRVVIDAARDLSARLERITADYRAQISAAWPMGDIYSSGTFALVIDRLAKLDGPELVETGLPQWLHADSYSLVVLLAHLAMRVAEATGERRLDLSVEAEAEGRFVYADLSWTGSPLPAPLLESWRSHRLADSLGGLSVGDILDHHRGDLWSEPVGGGRSRLRLPLPPPQQVHGRSEVSAPPRPEFFDFDLLHQPLPDEGYGRTPLRQLSYVVFDTETTGLSPSQGDELVSIAGVRIVNGRILTGETFHSLVNPRRPIPTVSTGIHGITDAMVADAPGPEAVLPQFRAFVGDSVVVAHNAAFDLKFLRMKQRKAGVVFDTPVLDTMILSRQIQGEAGEHSLDGIAGRLGLQITDRHSALGDALVTAAIFLRFLDLLEEQGIRTLDEAIRRSNMAVELHARERAF